MKKTKKPTKPSKLCYAIARLACRPFSARVFKRKFYRNAKFVDQLRMQHILCAPH